MKTIITALLALAAILCINIQPVHAADSPPVPQSKAASYSLTLPSADTGSFKQGYSRILSVPGQILSLKAVTFNTRFIGTGNTQTSVTTLTIELPADAATTSALKAALSATAGVPSSVVSSIKSASGYFVGDNPDAQGLRINVQLSP